MGKAWDLHVTEALRTDLDEGVAMVRDSIAFLRGQGRRVFFDAEHFFDGYRADPVFAMRVLEAAEESGAERLVLCDTNGGMLPFDIAAVVGAVRAQAGVPLGIHVHNDAGCAVANSLVAFDAGVFQVQGTVNGYGERTGNADLIPIAADLVLKMGVEDALPDGSVQHLTELAHYVAEVANLAPDSYQPFAGRHAFTHKAGLHTSGVARLSEAYEHVPPEIVGNRRGIVASDYAGGATMRMKAVEFGLDLSDDAVAAAVLDLKERAAGGYAFDVAEASLELLLRRAAGWEQPFFGVESYRVHVEERASDGEAPLAEATVKVHTKGTRHIESAEGHGPVGALDNALRKALGQRLPGAGRDGLGGLPGPCAGRERRHRRGRAGAHRHVERRARDGAPWGSARTSSKPRGRRWSTPTRTDSCTPASTPETDRGVAMGRCDLDRPRQMDPWARANSLTLPRPHPHRRASRTVP